jgi:hypothetical protein
MAGEIRRLRTGKTITVGFGLVIEWSLWKSKLGRLSTGPRLIRTRSSVGGYQYTVYWAADRVLTVARRCLESDTVQRVRLEDYVLAAGFPESQRSNGHRNTVLGISPGDGRLHLSWDHHNNDLNYTRSRAGLLTEPPERLSPADFEPRQPVVPGAPQRVTYPRFFNGPDETLYFFYRSGGSGAGNIALFQYQDASGSGT